MLNKKLEMGACFDLYKLNPDCNNSSAALFECLFGALKVKFTQLTIKTGDKQNDRQNFHCSSLV